MAKIDIPKKDSFVTMASLGSMAKKLFNLNDKEAAEYIDKWGEILAQKLSEGYFPAFIRPKADGSLDIEIYGHNIENEKE